MLYLYLDESGDLGFDFKRKSSKHFTITILCFTGTETNRALGYAVKKTLARKLNPRNHRKIVYEELKYTNTTLETKKYLYRQIQRMDFSLYAITLSKQKVLYYANENKARLYNYVTKLVLDKIPVENASGGIEFIIDKSKERTAIARFDSYIRQNLQTRLTTKTQLNISQKNSKEQQGLQIADMFCGGIFQKYEQNKTDWFNIFKEKITFAQEYLG
jgi:hypothetical protein